MHFLRVAPRIALRPKWAILTTYRRVCPNTGCTPLQSSAHGTLLAEKHGTWSALRSAEAMMRPLRSSATGGRNRELAHLSDFGQESSPHVNVVGAAPTGTEFGRGSGELRMLGVFVLSCRDA